MIDLLRANRDPLGVFDELLDLQDDFNRAFGGWGWRRPGSRRAFPPMNVWSGNDGVVVDVELPGAEPKDVDVSVTGDELCVRGKVNGHTAQGSETVHRCERPNGEFERTLQLPFRANAAGVKAAYHNGVLRVTVPRSEEEKPRKIAIEAA